MKTEMQQLKENADREKAKETLSEIGKYMDDLLTQMREGHALHRRSSKLEMAALGTIILTLFFAEELIHDLAFLLFLLTAFRNWAYIYPKVVRASYEFDGCIRTLEILGMLDRGDKHRRKSKRYRQSWIAAAWARAKPDFIKGKHQRV